jgi:signal transduction histidine kinase
MSSKIEGVFSSLKIRLILVFVILLFTLSTISFGLIYWSLTKNLDLRAEQKLKELHLDLSRDYNEEILDVKNKKPLKKALEELKEQFDYKKSRFVENRETALLLDENDKIILASANQAEYDSPGLILNAYQKSPKINGVLNDGPIYAFSASALEDGKILLLALDRHDDRQLIASYKQNFLISLGVLLILGSLLCYWIVAHLLKGIESVRKTSELIADGRFENRVLIREGESKEVTELANSFNVMIDKTESLIKELKDVTNNIAHDLRTPLTRIRGTVETRLMVDPNSDRETFGLVIEEVDRLMLLIDDMLTLAESESNLVALAKKPLNLNTMLQNLVEVFDCVLEDKGIKLKLNLFDSEIWVNAHEGRLQRAFANLLDNAIKYTEREGSIEFMSKLVDGHVCVSIQDSGCGIHPDQQKRVFERFYRLENHRGTPGNGLGLNLAKAFIENNDGKLLLQSELGKGSCFTVVLPEFMG